MTEVIGNILTVYTEEPHLCELCGKEKETRPYGKNGEEICFECMMSTPEREAEAKKRFHLLSNAET